MNYDLNTEEGMLNSAAWIQGMLDSGKHQRLIWEIPRSNATYVIDKVLKAYYIQGDNEDESTNRVLKYMGFTRSEN